MIWLKEAYLQTPNKLFINNYSYKEVYNKVITTAKKLYNPTKDNERVAIFSSNSKEALIVLLSLLLLKKEVVMLNFHLTKRELDEQIKQLEIKKIFSIDSSFTPFSEIESYPSSNIDFNFSLNMDKIAIIMNTSATTGKFKSVPITWGQIAAHVEASKLSLGKTSDDCWLAVLPIFHIGGLMILFRSMYNQTKILLLEKFDEEKTINLINEGKVNMLSLVPTMLKRIISNINSTHRLRVVLLGGEFIAKKLVEDSLEKNIPIYKTYGMTETTSQQTTFSVLENLPKLDSVGKPLSNVNITIKNKDKNGIGEIYLSSPMLTKGYLGKEPLERPFFTGDIGYLDNDDFLYILNRRDDIIISGGENIYPKEIEDLLYKLPSVKECAVVKKEDNKFGQIPILFLVADVDEGQLLDYLKDNLAKYKVPKEIYFLTSLPKNATGKILRKELINNEFYRKT